MDRTFNLQSSLFQSWKSDYQDHFKKCFAADMKYSKINRFIKDQSEQKQIYALLE